MGLSAGTRLGPYEVLAPLGAGGMGEVYRARDTRLGRQVAVKILPDSLSQDPRRVSRFETEARALAALSHPNILGIHDFGQSDGRIYAVTELLDGESLRDRMGGEPMAWRKASEIAASIADGLASAHAAGIVHRDLKPENVFITSDGRVKVLDFGLAKVVEPVSGDAVTLTSPSGGAVSVDGEVVGTLSYMAPEQLRGLKVDGRTDIFALGSLLYEMLSGKRPFTGATPADTLSAILSGEPRPLDASATSRIPPVLNTIVIRCLEKRAEDRFDTAHDLAIALRSISWDQSPAVVLPSTAASPRRRRRPWFAPALVVAALALAALAVFFKWPRTFEKSRTAAGGWEPPRQLTSMSGWEGEPALSRDGAFVAFSAGVSQDAQIWIVNPDKGEPVRLTDGDAGNRKPAWFPDGRFVAFARTKGDKTSVWKVSRDGGSASLLVENADMPAISSDGSLVAFCRVAPSGKTRIFLAPISDPARAIQVSGDEVGRRTHLDPAFSPDGQTLCFSDRANLWLVSSRGGPARPLTRDDARDEEPVFAPDGASVLFVSRRSDPPSLFRVSVEGGAPERVLPGGGAGNHPSISADGRRLVFSTLALMDEVVVVDRKTGNVCRFPSNRNAETPVLSSDGHFVAYVSNRIGKYDLWMEELKSGCPGNMPPRRLTNLETGPATPSFSPDGTWIAFFRAVKDWTNIWAVPVAGGEPVPLMESPTKDLHPVYSPDGTRLAFASNRSGSNHIWVVPLRAGLPAGEPWQLTNGDVEDFFPAWSPDGEQIAFARGDDVWVIEVRQGAAPRRVTTIVGLSHLAWETDGASILVTGLFGTSSLEVRRVKLPSGAPEPLKPPLILGDREGGGYLSLCRDGRYLATDIAKKKGNLWITTASRYGR